MKHVFCCRTILNHYPLQLFFNKCSTNVFFFWRPWSLFLHPKRNAVWFGRWDKWSGPWVRIPCWRDGGFVDRVILEKQKSADEHCVRLPDGEADGADLGLGAVGRQDVGALWPGQRAAGGGEGQVEHLHHICSGSHIMFLSAINPIQCLMFKFFYLCSVSNVLSIPWDSVEPNNNG